MSDSGVEVYCVIYTAQDYLTLCKCHAHECCIVGVTQGKIIMGKKRTDFVCVKAMAAYIQLKLGDVLCEGRRVESGQMGRYSMDTTYICV